MIKILITDDEPLVRAGIKSVIPWNKYGFEVIGEVWNGEDAYQKILELKPDILITDIKMPKMDGIALLKRLKIEHIPIQSLVLSCFDEFELVREAMKYGAHDYILKLSIDPEKLLEVLNEIKQTLATKDIPLSSNVNVNQDDLKYLFVNKLSKQGFSSSEQVNNVIHNISLSIQLENYYMVLLSLDAFPLMAPDDNRDRMIYNLLTQLCQRYPGNEIVSMDRREYLMILSAGENPFLFHQISAAMEQYANRSTFFGISSCLKDYTDFHLGYTQAEEALHAATFYQHKGPVSYTKLTEERFPSINASTAQKLYIYLSSADGNQAVSLVKELLDHLNDALFYYSRCYSYVVELLNIYIRVAREQNFSISQVPWADNPIFEALKKAPCLCEWNALLTDFTYAFTTYVHTLHTTERTEIMTIREYIQGHYMENIDLNTISTLVRITPSHLSNVFKKETGENFSTYLTRIRMEAAKKLLYDSQLLIYEVAEKTGYSDAGYFGKAFKKYWGISPEEFRKQLGAAYHQ